MKKLIYSIFYFFVKLIYRHTDIIGAENLEDNPCIIVSNHAQMHAPIAFMLYHPRAKKVWCAGEMMCMKEVPDYAYTDFWSQKPDSIRWFYRILSYILAPLSECIFQSADTIAVYRDKRISSTFRDSVKALKEGLDIIIFPEAHTPYNNIVSQFQKGFVDLARLYYKDTGKIISFVPAYTAPELSSIFIGRPVKYDPCKPSKEGRTAISAYLQDEITRMARGLPKHRVIPFENVSKDEYPENI